MKNISDNSKKVGEVVASNTHNLTVQCYHLYESPPFGAVVNTENPTTYSVVSTISTDSLDPGRPVIARGNNEEHQEDIYNHNPQLSKLLFTRFEAIVIGHVEDKKIVQGLPPIPPPIHAFVYTSTSNDLESLANSLEFLRILSNSAIPSVDEIIISCLQIISRQIPEGERFLIRAGKVLALNLQGQLTRLNSILRRLS